MTVPRAAGSGLVHGMGRRAWEEVQSLELGWFVLLGENVSTWAELGKTKFPVQQGVCYD